MILLEVTLRGVR